MKDLQTFPFTRVKKYKKRISTKNNGIYAFLSQYFSTSEVRNIYFKEPAIFDEDIDVLKSIFDTLSDTSKYSVDLIKTQIVQKPSRLANMVKTYHVVFDGLNQQGSERKDDGFDEK